MTIFQSGFACIAAMGAFLIAAPAIGDVTVSEERVSAFDPLAAKARLRFEPLASVEANDVEPQLINGFPVNPEFFPAIFRMTTGGTCTATMIGPATILLAAHCVDHLSFITFVAGGEEVTGICEQAPGFESIDASEDWALCLLEHEISGFAYESVDLDAAPDSGDTLILTGYGCTFEGGPLDGLLRIGVSRVVEKPAGWPDETSSIYTASDINAGGAILCPGDSGGPLFRFSGGFDDKREIVGVNSRTTFEFGISLFSGTASPAGKAFIESWAEEQDLQICGLNMVEGCK